MDARRLKEIGEELQRMSEMAPQEDKPNFFLLGLFVLGWLANLAGIVFLLRGGISRDWGPIDIAVGLVLGGLAAQFVAMFWPD